MNLTPKELLTALKYYQGQLGGKGCIGCPNAIPGSEDRFEMCKCRFNLNMEMIRFLEEYLRKEELT